MKHTIYIFISVILSLCMLCPHVSAAENNIISLNATNAAVGGYVTVAVVIENAAFATGFTMNVTYDNTALVPVSVEKGNSLGMVDPVVNTNYAPDKIRVGYISTSPVTTGTMLSIRFKAIREGTYTVTADNIIMRDSTSQSVVIPSSSSSCRVTIAPGQPTGLLIGDFTFTNSSTAPDKLSSGVNTAGVEIKNYTIENETITLYAAEYSTNGTLLQIVSDKLKFNSGSEATLKVNITPKATDSYVKLMLFRSNLSPLAQFRRIGR